MKRLAVESYTTRAHNSPYYVYMFTCDCMIYIVIILLLLSIIKKMKRITQPSNYYTKQDANQTGKAAEIHRTMKSTPEVWFQGAKGWCGRTPAVGG